MWFITNSYYVVNKFYKSRYEYIQMTLYQLKYEMTFKYFSHSPHIFWSRYM